MKKNDLKIIIKVSTLMLLICISTVGFAQNWNETLKAIASDSADEVEFGYTVSISGDRAIVGSPGGPYNHNYQGYAYVFELVGDTWIEKQKLTASDGDADDYFGYSVSISGDKAIVGAPPELNFNDGAVYIFENSNVSGISESNQDFFISIYPNPGQLRRGSYLVKVTTSNSIVTRKLFKK